MTVIIFNNFLLLIFSVVLVMLSFPKKVKHSLQKIHIHIDGFLKYQKIHSNFYTSFKKKKKNDCMLYKQYLEIDDKYAFS